MGRTRWAELIVAPVRARGAGSPNGASNNRLADHGSHSKDVDKFLDPVSYLLFGAFALACFWQVLQHQGGHRVA